MTSNFNLTSCSSLVSLCLLNLSLSLLLRLTCLAVSSLLAIPLYHTHPVACRETATCFAKEILGHATLMTLVHQLPTSVGLTQAHPN